MRITLLLLGLLVAACSSSPEPTATEPTVDVSDITATFDTLVAAEAYRFDVTREGPPFPIDVFPGLGASRLAGTFVTPAALSGTVTGGIGPMTLTVPIVQVADTIWLENPLTGGWEELAAASLVDVAGLVATDGVPRLVFDDLTDLERGEDGTITGTLDTTRISQRSGGVVGVGSTTATVAVADDVLGIRFADPQDQAATWVVSIGPPTDPIGISAP